MFATKQEFIECISRARESGHVVTLAPPLNGDEIARLESRCGRLPGDIRELVEYASGFAVGDVTVDFRGDESFEFETVFPCSVAIAGDRRGNFWVADVLSSRAWGAIFFVAHDPPVVLVQAPNLAVFMVQVLETRNTAELTGDDVARIWSENPYLLSRPKALASPDDAVRKFAAELQDSFSIADLRDLTRGNGFVWGSAGPDTTIVRAGDELLFGVEQKKRSFLSRFFGGRS